MVVVRWLPIKVLSLISFQLHTHTMAVQNRTKELLTATAARGVCSTLEEHKEIVIRFGIHKNQIRGAFDCGTSTNKKAQIEELIAFK